MNRVTTSDLREQFADRFAVLDEARRAALVVRQVGVVVDAKHLIDAGQQIAGAEGAVAGFGSIGGCRADDLAFADSSSAQDRVHGAAPVAASRVGVDARASAEFAAGDD